MLERVPSNLAGVVGLAQDLAGLYQDYRSFGQLPSENELVAHLVVPFLRVLGWPAERIAVEWRGIDVAAFGHLPRAPEGCRLVIEAKRFGTGVEGARNQAVRYVEALGLSCDAVVTDGIRYRLYAASRGYEREAYANLLRLKQSGTRLFDRMRATA